MLFNVVQKFSVDVMRFGIVILRSQDEEPAVPVGDAQPVSLSVVPLKQPTQL